MFPHLFIHWLTARRAAHFRYTVVFYPLFIAIVWVPSVLLGVLGNDAFPGLAGPAANSILVRLIDAYAPGLLAGLLAAGVFSACMNSVDSQALALGNMSPSATCSRTTSCATTASTIG
jgi:SSS family solute:Na+ symporter